MKFCSEKIGCWNRMVVELLFFKVLSLSFLYWLGGHLVEY